MFTATFDIGTTAVKAALVSDDRQVVFHASLPIETLQQNDYREQSPQQWFRACCALCQHIIQAGFQAESIHALIMSGQMQDFIPVNADGDCVGNAILYSDARANLQADSIRQQLGEDTVWAITGNQLNGALPVAKLLWFNQYCQAQAAQTACVLVSAKDYVISQLCRVFVTDVTSASTFGLMDIKQKCWHDDFLDALSIPRNHLPEIKHCHEIAGWLTAEAANVTGLIAGTPVYIGSGDAGASTLASGICQPDEYSVYLGTTGWIAAVSDHLLSGDGVFNLAAIPANTYINVVPFLNAGNVHQWISSMLQANLSSCHHYDEANQLLTNSDAGSHDLLFLPYLTGERFPVMDNHIRGCYLGINDNTSRADMARACLEGVAFSIRQGLETISPRQPKKVTLVGGGAQVPVWRQILADVLDHDILVPDQSEYLPAMVLASAVLTRQGDQQHYQRYLDQLLMDSSVARYQPDANAVKTMQRQYQRFQRVYPTIKDLFHE